jgi:hypothetical protein
MASVERAQQPGEPAPSSLHLRLLGGRRRDNLFRMNQNIAPVTST